MRRNKTDRSGKWGTDWEDQTHSQNNQEETDWVQVEYAQPTPIILPISKEVYAHRIISSCCQVADLLLAAFILTIHLKPAK